MLDSKEGRNYEIAPGIKVHIFPADVAPALEAAFRPVRTQAYGDAAIHRRSI